MTANEELQQTVIDFKMTFDSEHGKKVLAKLATFCCAKSPIFVENSTRKTMYNLGAHAVYRYIMHFIEWDDKKEQPTKTIS